MNCITKNMGKLHIFGTSLKEPNVNESSVVQRGFNSLPNDKILEWSKLKAFADNKIIVTEKFEFCF